MKPGTWSRCALCALVPPMLLLGACRDDDEPPTPKVAPTLTTLYEPPAATALVSDALLHPVATSARRGEVRVAGGVDARR